MGNEILTKNAGIPLEIKSEDEEYLRIEGYASTFGDLDRVDDIISKGAFTNTLTKRKPKLLNQHDMSQVIGVIDSAVELQEGLYIKARLPKANSMVRDLEPLLKMGALGDFSIGYNVVDSESSPDGVRTIKEIDLWEVSIVTIPANANAKITAVKKKEINEKKEAEKMESDEKIIDAIKAESITSKKEFEQALRDTGVFTRKAVVILASKFIEDVNQGDLDDAKNKQSDSVDEGKLLDAINELKNTLTKKD